MAGGGYIIYQAQVKIVIEDFLLDNRVIKRSVDKTKVCDLSTLNKDSPETTLHNRETLMKDIKDLLDPTNRYLPDLVKRNPGIGSDFLALLPDGVS